MRNNRKGGKPRTLSARPSRTLLGVGELDPIALGAIAFGLVMALLLVTYLVASISGSFQRGELAAAAVAVLMVALTLLYAWRDSDGRQGGAF